MNFPEFYRRARVGKMLVPDTTHAVASGRAAGVAPSSQDERRVVLLLVDAQVDFVHADGALSVPGAVEDTCRTVEWLFGNIDRVTAIAASLDSHIPIQIFFPTWWVDADGEHPQPFTPIPGADVAGGRWKPVYEPAWSREYVKRLEADARKELMIWPYHTLIGTPGHTLTPALYEAIAFHSAARRSQPTFLAKGSIARTEHYSMMEPEVKVPEEPLGSLNTQFLDMLAAYDLIYVAGQAKSHCVLETVKSTMRYYRSEPQLIAKLRILSDCTSPVVHPEINFDAMANEAFRQFEQEGLRMVRSSDPIE